MEEKQICCCGSSGWTRVLGWFQLIGSAISMIVISLLVAKPSAQYLELFSKKSLVVFTFGYPGLIVCLFSTALSFAMGIALLKGSYGKNHRLVQMWIIYAIVAYIVGIVDTLGGAMASENSPDRHGETGLGVNLFSLALSIPLQIFFVWVVNTHKKEIIAEQRPLDMEKD